MNKIITLTEREYLDHQEWFSVYYFESGMSYDTVWTDELEYDHICRRLGVADIHILEE